jgi:hypothetical protein
MNDIASSHPHADLREEIARRVNEIQLQLLDWIKREISDGKVPRSHFEAYETLCRAEATRRKV